MNKILKRPAVNAMCLGIFSAFYGFVFILSAHKSGFKELLFLPDNMTPFWMAWSRFLASGYQATIAYITIVLTVMVIALLLTRRKPYDEYHTSVLTSCLTVAIALTLIAIAIFYLMILCDPTGVVEKFTLFAVVHLVTVVLADLVFVLLCRWR